MAKFVLPVVTAEGALVANDVATSGGANRAVAEAWRAMGGQVGYNEWAKRNPDTYYEKHFGKLIVKTVETTGNGGDIEDLLAAAAERHRKRITEMKVVDAEPAEQA